MENVCCAAPAKNTTPAAATASTRTASATATATTTATTRTHHELYDGKIAGLYDLEKTLGSGHFAVVKLARHVFTGEKVAVKVIDKTKIDEVSHAHLYQEVRCMKLVQHPNVVRLYEVIDTQTKLYLILELGDGGDLYDYIMKHESGLSERLAAKYFRQIVRAIAYCHQLHVVHRDLKPENVVFFEKLGVVKLTDFGFSNRFYPGQKLETSCGSLEYMAPEILLGDSYDAPAVDVWSLGVILYMLVCGRPPFQERNDSETLTKIMDCKYSMPEHISAECRELIGAMLVVAPEKRFTLRQIGGHRWLRADRGAAGDETLASAAVAADQVDRVEGEAEEEEVPELLPLVSRRQVTDEDHAAILVKMVNGNIATKEEITEAIEKNEYNHITATYYLLAERKLRANRPDSSATTRKPYAQSFLKSRQHPVAMQLALLPPVPAAAPPLLRPPSVDGPQAGRIRKCSIVQEEDDDEEEADVDDEVITDATESHATAAADCSLNRRGSRSEGRLNLTVADITAEAAAGRAANQHSVVTTTDSAAGTPDILLIAPRPSRSGSQCSSRSSSSGFIATGVDHRPILEPGCGGGSGSETIPEQPLAEDCADDVSDDAVQVTSSPSVEDARMDIAVAVRTLHSSFGNAFASSVAAASAAAPPPRCSVLLGSSTLNEIYEEATDCGSSADSASTTPRSLSRHSTVTTASTSTTATAARRTKMHKTRTASCSSSDASDDDSENRKKRAHKIVGDTAGSRFQPQRRDSYDDSSDSQEPGGGGNAVGTAMVAEVAAQGGGERGGNRSTGGGGDGHSAGGGSSTGDSGATHRQKGGGTGVAGAAEHSKGNFRRHRTGHRHRAGETRLRESQSLNRITEVQESDPAVLLMNGCGTAMAAASSSAAITTTGVSAPNTNLIRTPAEIDKSSSSNSGRSAGFSSRLFHGFRRHHASATQATGAGIGGNKFFDPAFAPVLCCAKTGGADKDRLTGQTDQLVVDLSGALKQHSAAAAAAEPNNTGGNNNTNAGGGASAMTKKLKILGRYFQVNSLLSNNLKF